METENQCPICGRVLETIGDIGICDPCTYGPKLFTRHDHRWRPAYLTEVIEALRTERRARETAPMVFGEILAAERARVAQLEEALKVARPSVYATFRSGGFGANEAYESLAQIDQALAAEPSPSLPSRPVIVCLCGSTRFSEAFRDANLRETLAGKIVLTVGCDTHSDDELFRASGPNDIQRVRDLKERLDELHKRKIDLADEVLILNVDGYIGYSTRSELAYARSLGKVIRWLEPEKASAALAALDGEETS